MQDARRFAPATLRNRQPILDVLRRVLPETAQVLEIASGSGEHAVFFASSLPGVIWQPSDVDPANLASIAAWTAALGLQNVCPPLALDVTAPDWPVGGEVEAVLCINMIHIAPWAATVGLIQGAALRLRPSCPLILYGPFSRGGAHIADSNREFDLSLRARNPDWGVRDLEAVESLAAAAGFAPAEVVEMPANNLAVILRRI